MGRAFVCSIATLLLLPVGLVQAADAKKDEDQHRLQGTITKVDAQNDTISVKTMDKNGKQQEKTLHLAKDAKISNSVGKDAKLDSFKAGDDVCVTQKNDQITELKKHAEAKITKIDAKAGTITVKMPNQDGKEVEKTFRLIEESEYVDSTGRVAELEVFRSGDEILFVEAEGNITAMKKADHHQTTTGSKDDAGKEKKKSSDK